MKPPPRRPFTHPWPTETAPSAKPKAKRGRPRAVTESAAKPKAMRRKPAVRYADTAAPDPSPRTRQVQRPTTPPMPDTIPALVTYFNQAVAYLQPPFTAPVPDPMLLRTEAVRGAVTYAEYHGDGGEVGLTDGGPVVAFALDFGKPRFITPAGFFLLRVLTLFETTRYEAPAVHGVEVLGSGFKLTRLMANADETEEVRLLGHHSDLRPWSLEIVPGLPRHDRQRGDAIRFALECHRESDASSLISAGAYAAMLKGAFRLFDAEHGAHFLRELPVAGGV